MVSIYSTNNEPFKKTLIEQYNDNELPDKVMKHIKKVQNDIEKLIDK